MGFKSEVFDNTVKTVAERTEKFGFALNSDLCDFDSDEPKAVFEGEKGVLTLKYADGKLFADLAEDAEDPDSAKNIMRTLLPAAATAGDIDYIGTELADTLDERYSSKKAQSKKPVQKQQRTVSKDAVKHGSFYDPFTLATRLCLVFPELRPTLKLMSEQYDEFLAEEYFENYAADKVVEAIRQNDPKTMKKLFQMLNEIYEDGTNDTQDIIAVTILGKLDNDQILLATAVDYMSASRKGKRLRAKMADPPAYKPKKKKKPGLMSRLMSGGNPGALGQ